MRIRDREEKLIKEDGNNWKILVIDDEQGVIDSINVYLGKMGYIIEGETDPLKGIEKIRENDYDILILDYIMNPINGDKVIEEIRKFNNNIYIIVLTGHKSIETIRKLNIQGYVEKTNKFEQILLMVESSVKSIKQLEEIRKKNKEIEDTYLESIETLRKIVEAKDEYTRGHSDRVSGYACLIGKKFCLAQHDLETLRIGGLLHDIGKVGIKDSILLKTGRFTDEEYEEMKKHTVIGYEILKKASRFKDILNIVRSHHERIDRKRLSRWT